MSQELEIEFKNMLTKKEFEKIKSYYQFSSEQFVIQKNHYYDTPSFSLKEKGAALRIREKQQRFVLTLKEPAPVGLMETHQVLAEKKLPQGLIVLDHSRYLMVEDFEIEFEVTDYERGKRDFSELLKSFGIPERETKNKIVRFYEQKLKDQ